MKNKKDNMEYEDLPKLSRTKKSGIRVVSEMSNVQIVTYFVSRNRYPLSIMTNLALGGFFVWDKIGRIFF